MADFAVQTLRRPDAPVHGTLFLPERPSAGVLVIGGSGGSEPSYVGEALARAGIGALSVAYFGRPGLPGRLRDIPLEYFLAALEVLQGRLAPGVLQGRLAPGVLQGRLAPGVLQEEMAPGVQEAMAPGVLQEAMAAGVPIVVLGMSRGSEAAMLTAIYSGGRVGAVVAGVPGNVVAGSWPPGGPAWLLEGRALAFVAHSGPESEDPAALIPVELVPGPILLVAAGTDRVWPSADMARALSARLREHGDAHGHTVLEYPDVGHSLGYLIPRLPPGLLPPDLVDEPADRAARADAWPKVVDFICRAGGI